MGARVKDRGEGGEGKKEEQRNTNNKLNYYRPIFNATLKRLSRIQKSHHKKKVKNLIDQRAAKAN